MASASRWSTSGGRATGEGGGSGDGGGHKGFRLFGTWLQGPGDDAVNHGGGDERQKWQQEGEEQGEHVGESSHHGQGARLGRGPARRPKSKATPWTVEEHRRFLRGLEEKGKGNWAAIAKEFVKTRNGTQVASHAQKHFLQQHKAAAGVKPRHGISIFDVALEAEEDDDDAAGAGESQGAGSVEAPPPPGPPDPSPVPETPHRGTSSPQRTPWPREVAPPPQPYRPLLLGIGVAPPPPMLHLATPHAAPPAAFLPCQNVKFGTWMVPWAPLKLTDQYFAATHGPLQQHHQYAFQQQLASVAPSSLSQDSEEEDATNLAKAA